MATGADGHDLGQVNLFVKDFDGMLRFYRDAVGLPVNPVDPGPPCEPMVNWASLAAGPSTLELFDAATFWDSTLLARDRRGAVQLCFKVDHVERERDRLATEGIACDPVVTEPWGRYASFRDPEGNWLQRYETSGPG